MQTNETCLHKSDHILYFVSRCAAFWGNQCNQTISVTVHFCTCLQVFWPAPRGGCSCCPWFVECLLLAACFIVPWRFVAMHCVKFQCLFFNDVLPTEVSSLVISHEVHPKQWHMWPSDPDTPWPWSSPSPCSGLFVYHSLCPSLQFVVIFLFAAMSREVS